MDTVVADAARLPMAPPVRMLVVLVVSVDVLLLNTFKPQG
jgi:hypothetical protein